MRKVTNEEIRRTSQWVNLLGSLVIMLFALYATYQLLANDAPTKEILSILFTGLICFVFFRGSSWLVGGFEQKTVPENSTEEKKDIVANVTTEEDDDDSTIGSRFLHRKKQSLFGKK